jgi:hypothetical protein
MLEEDAQQQQQPEEEEKRDYMEVMKSGGATPQVDPAPEVTSGQQEEPFAEKHLLGDQMRQERIEDGEEEGEGPQLRKFLSKFSLEFQQQTKKAIMLTLCYDFPDKKSVHLVEFWAKVPAQYELSLETLKGFVSVLDAENRLFFDDQKRLIHKL